MSWWRSCAETGPQLAIQLHLDARRPVKTAVEVRDVPAGAAVDDIASSVPGVDDVVPRAAEHRVAAAAWAKDVRPATAADHVVTGCATDVVVVDRAADR